MNAHFSKLAVQHKLCMHKLLCVHNDITIIIYQYGQSMECG